MQKRICHDGRLHPMTFAQVLQRVAADEGLSKSRKHYAGTSLRVFIRLTGANAAREQASFQTCRNLAAGFSPIAHRIKPRYWTTIRCGVAYAINRYVDREWPGKLPHVSAGWRRLIRNSNRDRAVTHGLSRFMRFCTVLHISPSRVANEAAARYRTYLLEHSTVDSPHAVYRRTLQNWNWATTHVPGWPRRKLKVPRRESYVLPWTSFPRSLQADGERWKRCVTAAHPLDPRAPRLAITMETAEHRLRNLRAFASAMVHEGVPSSRIKTLADLARPEHFRKGVKFLWRRFGGKRSAFQYNAYGAVKYMSQYWARVDPATLAVMAKVVGRCRCRAVGITPKVLRILQQFDNPLTRERLLSLPQLMVGLAERIANPKAAALAVQRALAIELLLVAPIRLKNLAALRLDRNFVAIRHQGQRDVRLVISREEVKNIVPLDFPLPAETIALLDLYIRHYRPVLLGRRSLQTLFPGSIDGHAHKTTLSSAITRALQRYAGLIMHVHAFRHLAAKLFLERNPRRYDLVALLLGHRSVETTRNFYCALEMQAVGREYSRNVIGRGAEPSPRNLEVASPLPLLVRAG
jgi:integrase